MNQRPHLTAALPDIASPFSFGKLALRNRVVMAPMTRQCAPDGVPTAAMADYYAKRAKGGVGLIITEGAAPNESGRFGANVPCLYGRDALLGWERITKSARQAGAAIFAQIWHIGAFSPAMIGMQVSHSVERLSPSGRAGPGCSFGRALTPAEINQTLRDYGTAARNAREAGFDGVEIHAAHGYLPDQFFWDQTNQRQDCYGGDLTSRTRFAAEIVSECKARAGSDFPVTLRLSQWKQLDYMARIVATPEDLAAWLAPLNAAGADGYHVSTRRYWDAAFSGDDETLAGWVRRMGGKPVIAVGSALLDTDFKAASGKDRSELVPEGLGRINDGLRIGQFDLIAFGRALLANPDLADHLIRADLSALRPYRRTYLDRLE